MKLSKIFNETMLAESDVLKFNPELKSVLVQEIPMMIKKINRELRSDNYTTLVKQLEMLSQAADRAKQLLTQTLQTQGSKIHNKEAQNSPQQGISTPKAFSINDEEL